MTFQYRQQNPPPSRQRLLFSAGALPRLVSFRPGRWCEMEAVYWNSGFGGVCDEVGAACCVYLHPQLSGTEQGDMMADAQAGRAILEQAEKREARPARAARAHHRSRLSWMIPACHHSQISIPSTLRDRQEEKKKRPSSWGPWRVQGPGCGLGMAKQQSCNWGPGHAALPIHPPGHPASLPLPSPPPHRLARPWRLTDSAADRAGPFHPESGCVSCCCRCRCRCCASHQVTQVTQVTSDSDSDRDR